MLASEIDYPLLRGQLVVVQDEDCAPPGTHNEIAQYSHTTQAGEICVVYRRSKQDRLFPARDVYILPLGWNAAGDARYWPLPIPNAAERKRALRNSKVETPDCKTAVIQLLSEALAVRSLATKCPDCGVDITGRVHAARCRYFKVETIAREAYMGELQC